MSDLDDLKKFLVPAQKSRSVSSVLKIEGRNVFVTEKGQTRVVNLLPGDASVYKAGDQIIVEGGLVIGRTNVRQSKVLYL